MSDGEPRATPPDEGNWSPAWSNAVFSIAERGRRWTKVRALMKAARIDLLVCLPCTSRHDRAAADARYLCQLGENGDAVTLAFPVDYEPTAWQSRAGVWPSGNWVSDIRAARRGMGGATICDWIEENPRFRDATIAIAGLNSGPLSCVRAGEGDVSWNSLELLKARCPKARFVSATPIMGQARWRKSNEEVAFLRRATQIAETTFDTLLTSAAAGVRERHVFARMMFANADAGGSFPAMIGWTSGHPGRLPHRLEQPTFRMLERGDQIMVEIEGRWGGHIAQVDRTLAIGDSPSDLKAAMALNFKAFDRALAAIKPGATVRAIAEAAGVRGMGGRARGELNLQGRGCGDDGPLIASGLGGTEAYDIVIEEDCCLTLKPNIRLDGVNGHFCRWGDTVLVTANGAVRLGTRAPDFPIL